MPSVDSLVDEFVSAIIGIIGEKLSDGAHDFVPPAACSVARAAKVYGIGPARLRTAIDAGDLATYCDGKVLLADVDVWFRTQRDRKPKRVRLVG